MNPLKLLIFDLDGTLIDSLPDLTDATNAVRHRFGLAPLDAQGVRKLVGQGSRVLVQRTLEGFSAADIEEGLAIFLKYNEDHIADKTRLYPGVAETLAAVAERDIAQCVLSNKNIALCRQVLDAFDISRYFSAVYGADSFPFRKPSPEPVLALLSEFKVPAGESAMIGDSINDIAAGNGAGSVTIGCSYGYGDSSELDEATYLVDRFAAILDIPVLGRKG